MWKSYQLKYGKKGEKKKNRKGWEKRKKGEDDEGNEESWRKIAFSCELTSCLHSLVCERLERRSLVCYIHCCCHCSQWWCICNYYTWSFLILFHVLLFPSCSSSCSFLHSSYYYLHTKEEREGNELSHIIIKLFSFSPSFLLPFLMIANVFYVATSFDHHIVTMRSETWIGK